MRTKEDILEANHVYALKSGDAQEIALLQQLHTLEVLIDIRDAIITDAKDAMNALIEIRKTEGGD